MLAMGNISNILGHPFVPSDLEVRILDSPERQLEKAMLENGLTPPSEIILDGKLRRFHSGTRGQGGHGEKTGWYVAFSGDLPAGKFGCWRGGIELPWRADIGRKFTMQEEMANTRRMAEAKAIRDTELERSHNLAANTVTTIWNNATHATSEHGYLARKGIQPNGARVTGDGRLIVPLYDTDNELSSLQYISVDGEKRYHSGGSTLECFNALGTDEKKSTIYVAEGFATSASIYEETNQLTYIAYSASNIPNVVKYIREIYGASQSICVIADNDESGVGRKYADQASAKYNCNVVMPPEKGDANDYKQSGGDLGLLLSPKKDDWLIHADDFSAQPSPISWLVKGWIQDQALIMVHGPSGGGKTFVVLDWCLTIASSINKWFDSKVKNGSIVYLAGEGHHGLRGRVAAWKYSRNVDKLNMWLSQAGCDLNTQEGYHRVVNNIRSLDVIPKIIVVDTLHRFLLGDENSSQDAKTMLDACSKLMAEFNCSVLLVHHTGINEAAQDRARGSSAWRGALDIEISIVPSKNDTPMQIIQRKSKDAELAADLFCTLETVQIPGWFDEDKEPVTSAVVLRSEGVIDKPKQDSKINEAKKTIQRAWFASDCETREGCPYVSRSALKDILSKDGIKDRTIINIMTPSRDGGLINILINSETIENYEHGYLIIDNAFSSALMLSKLD
jgi:phage/plasmid primase-like uncharacterized protein